jgi:superfamily I DNA/RNA helicase
MIASPQRVQTAVAARRLLSLCPLTSWAPVDGVLPTVRSEDPAVVGAAISEGRRLLSVAVTRAVGEIVISNAIWAD